MIVRFKLTLLSLQSRELLGWMVVHCKHLVANEKLNKCGGLQGVCATFAPLLHVSTKTLSALVCYSATLFPGIHVARLAKFSLILQDLSKYRFTNS